MNIVGPSVATPWANIASGSVASASSGEMREQAHTFSIETKTIEECRDLISRLSGEGGELFEALLEAIALDSEKHHRLLSAVEKLLG